jgi:hypothetical protein
MKITRDIEVKPSPQELAEMFWDMGSHEQAAFFNHLHLLAGGVKLRGQLYFVSLSTDLNEFGRAGMRYIGEAADKTNL